MLNCLVKVFVLEKFEGKTNTLQMFCLERRLASGPSL